MSWLRVVVVAKSTKFLKTYLNSEGPSPTPSEFAGVSLKKLIGESGGDEEPKAKRSRFDGVGTSGQTDKDSDLKEQAQEALVKGEPENSEGDDAPKKAPESSGSCDIQVKLETPETD